MKHNVADSSIYGLGVIGAAIYFIGQSTTFRVGALGLLKAFIRPVFVVRGLLEILLV